MTVQRMLPLYEAKMIHHYDHRWATYDVDGSTRPVTGAEKSDPDYQPIARYWLREEVVTDRLKNYGRTWIAGWRNIARATDERTTIAFSHPVGATGNASLLIRNPDPLLIASLSSFASDYVARQKMAGTNFTYNYFQQIVALSPKWGDRACPWSAVTFGEWVRNRQRELVFTSHAMSEWARDQGDAGSPFVWDPERRFWLRAELDAAFFHLYGVDREDVDYIMETFPIVKRKDIAAHGSFRTKEAILSIYDAMARATEAGREYETVLSPPPGEGARHEATEQAS